MQICNENVYTLYTSMLIKCYFEGINDPITCIIMYSESSELILNLYSLQALKTCNIMLYIVVRAVLGNSQQTFVMILVT